MTPWTVARQAPLSMGFSRQEYWRGLPFPSPGDLPGPGIELVSSIHVSCTAGGFVTSEPPGKPKDQLMCFNSKGSKAKQEVIKTSFYFSE